jgi:hypothetical protein
VLKAESTTGSQAGQDKFRLNRSLQKQFKAILGKRMASNKSTLHQVQNDSVFKTVHVTHLSTVIHLSGCFGLLSLF